MIIKNGSVFQEDGSFQVQDLYMEQHKLVSAGDSLSDRTVVDASGLMVIPGLIDIHSHGAFGHDFSDADSEGLKKILEYEKAHGITSYCPTSMTLPMETLKQIFASAGELTASDNLAHIPGFNMEGPFLSVEKKGAHDERHIINPDIEFFRELNKACGHKIRFVTIAPETEGAMEFIHALKDETVLSLGHTNSNYDTCIQAAEKGASHVTHLYNAMPPLNHREPGLIGAAADKGLRAELICDGIHVHPSMVRAAFRLFGSENMILISDSMRATGLQNGTYDLGGQTVYVTDGKATLENGTIAGSATNLYDCMRKAISFGIPAADAIFAATRNPAKAAGIYGQTGSITIGKEADLLLVDKSFQLVRVL